MNPRFLSVFGIVSISRMKAGGILEWVHDLAPSFARTQPFVDASSGPFCMYNFPQCLNEFQRAIIFMPISAVLGPMHRGMASSDAGYYYTYEEFAKKARKTDHHATCNCIRLDATTTTGVRARSQSHFSHPLLHIHAACQKSKKKEEARRIYLGTCTRSSKHARCKYAVLLLFPFPSVPAAPDAGATKKRSTHKRVYPSTSGD